MKFLLMYLLWAFSLYMPANTANESWQLKKEADGIKVFVRDKSGSSVKEIRLQTILDTPIDGFLYVLGDKSGLKKWVYNCSESKLLEAVSARESYHYQVTDAPWPIQDRDIIIHTKVISDEEPGKIQIIAKGAPDYIPEKDGFVRVKDYYALWDLKVLPGNKVQIDYQVSLDPGGSIPVWVYNLAVTEGPFKTMQKLREILPQYRNAKVDY